MTGFKPFFRNRGLRAWAVVLGVALTALAAYAISLADCFFPGQSAHLMAQWNGMDALAFPVHPVWGRAVRFVTGLSFPAAVAVRVNLLSLVSAVVAASLLSLFAMCFVWQTISQEDSLKLAKGTTLIAGGVTGFTFIFSTALWLAGTHLDYHVFDVALALVFFLVLLPATRFRHATLPLAFLLGVCVSLGVVEAAVFVGALPVYLYALARVCKKNRYAWYVGLFLFLVGFTIGFVIFSRALTSEWLASPAAAASHFENWGDYLQRMGRDYSREIGSWVRHPGWLYVFLFATLPFAVCVFAARRGLNSDRSWSQYLFHIGVTVCAILAFATPFTPEAVLRPWGILPIATTALAALVSGYVAAYWYLLARIPLPLVEFKEDGQRSVFIAGRRLAPAALGVFGAIMALAALLNTFTVDRNRGAFADICAGEILDRLGSRTWFVTDGLLDDHLRILAATRGRELNLVCLQRDMDDAYLKELGALVKERGLEVKKGHLDLAVELGVLPFLQDWFGGDPEIDAKAAVFGVPDFWSLADRRPVPDCLFFKGVKDAKAFDGAKARADFEAFWTKMDPILHAEAGKGSRAIAKCRDPLDVLRLQLRRHAGFIANNLAVALQDQKRDADAYALYELVLRKIDPDNVCALFNEFEMARAGFKGAVAHKVEIEKAIRAIIDDPKRRYILWSLSRYYGYIRSPEIFARMGYAWARSGQTGNAIAQVQRAIDFVPAERQNALLNMMAAIYASGQDAQKSRATYERVLATDSSNHDALIGLMRLSMQEGDMKNARTLLERAVKTPGLKKEVSGVEWALLHLMNNDLGAARLAMQKVTDLQPKSLQAWSLLAGVLLQQYDQDKDAKAKAKTLDELENVILPRMEAMAGSPRDYFVQMTRALVYMRKGEKFRKDARDALVVAQADRPNVSATGDMILNLDIAMDDEVAAEKHARTVLRRNRQDRLANYVMGSLRLKEGDYAAAETFLQTSVAHGKPIAAAQNDLAEVLRRLQRYAEAEKQARAAVVTAPELYVAWETLGSILLDEGKNLDEAETCVKKAIALTKNEKTGAKVDDVRMLITLARVQLARNDLSHARGTLRTLRGKQKELTNYDRNRVVDLLRAAKMD